MSLSWGNNISNGIEPIFSYYYVRNIRVPGKLTKVSEEVLNFTIFLIKKKFGVELEEAEKIAKEMGIETTNDLGGRRSYLHASCGSGLR
jgi:ribonucleotide reductase alpha subunit